MGLVGFLSAAAFCQTENTTLQQPVPAMVGVNNSAEPAETYNPSNSDDRMMTPPPVSGQSYPVALASQERANYLRGGLSFTSAYTDNALGGVSTNPVSDISYSVAPFIELDETTSRAHAEINYAPGFTFYQKTSSRNEADHNASIQFQYRLTPHVTFSVQDSFQKSSNVFNQPLDLTNGAVSGGAQNPNFSIIAPIADRLSNTGTVGLSYQYGLNDMIGGSGTFSNLHYPNQAEVPGLGDSSSQGGLMFYTRRVARGQYLGASYAYERLMSYPAVGVNETQTHAALLFYTFAPTSSKFSISFFGGPQYSDTIQPAGFGRITSWTPAGGASLGWQGQLTSFALSYIHIISSGGGLIGSVKQDSGTLSIRQQITKTLNGTVGGGYSQNDVIGTTALGVNNGHSISGTASLRQMIGQHVGVELGYSRVRQNYSNVQVISTFPDINREFISISYLFSRPLGR